MRDETRIATSWQRHFSEKFCEKLAKIVGERRQDYDNRETIIALAEKRAEQLIGNIFRRNRANKRALISKNSSRGGAIGATILTGIDAIEDKVSDYIYNKEVRKANQKVEKGKKFITVFGNAPESFEKVAFQVIDALYYRFGDSIEYLSKGANGVEKLAEFFVDGIEKGILNSESGFLEQFRTDEAKKKRLLLFAIPERDDTRYSNGLVQKRFLPIIDDPKFKWTIQGLLHTSAREFARKIYIPTAISTAFPERLLAGLESENCYQKQYPPQRLNIAPDNCNDSGLRVRSIRQVFDGKNWVDDEYEYRKVKLQLLACRIALNNEELDEAFKLYNQIIEVIKKYDEENKKFNSFVYREISFLSSVIKQLLPALHGDERPCRERLLYERNNDYFSRNFLSNDDEARRNIAVDDNIRSRDIVSPEARDLYRRITVLEFLQRHICLIGGGILTLASIFFFYRNNHSELGDAIAETVKKTVGEANPDRLASVSQYSARFFQSTHVPTRVHPNSSGGTAAGIAGKAVVACGLAATARLVDSHTHPTNALLNDGSSEELISEKTSKLLNFTEDELRTFIAELEKSKSFCDPNKEKEIYEELDEVLAEVREALQVKEVEAEAITLSR